MHSPDISLQPAVGLRVRGYHDLSEPTGGNSHEVFIARSDETGDEVVLRVYGAGSRHRGPEAPALQAAVLRLAGTVVSAPEVLEVRPVGPVGEPAVLATTRLPGVVLDDVLLASPDPDLHRSLGLSLGTELGRLASATLPVVGEFLDETLTRAYWQEGGGSLLEWLDRWLHRAPLARLSAQELANVRVACHDAQALLTTTRRACLVHGDLSPRNVLCDPDTGEVTGLFDWEFAHAGHPLEDTGHQLRERWDGQFAWAMLEALGDGLPVDEQASAEDLRLRARAADLYWIIELASRLGEGSATERCHEILLAIAAGGDLAAALPQ